MAKRAIVVGVGGLGAAVVDALASRGANVVGLERDAVPNDRGSSHGETRVIRTAYFESPRYVPLVQRAWTLWSELSSSSLGEPLLVRTGVLHVGPPEHEAMRGLLESVRVHALPHERIDDERIRALGIMPSPGDAGVLEEQGGFLRVERCTTALVTRATHHGARVLTHERVVEVDTSSATIRVRTASGKHIEADALVLCAGAWSREDDATRRFFDDVPLVVTRQPQLWFEPRASSKLPPAFIHFAASTAGPRAFYGIPPAREDGPMKVCMHHPGDRAHPDTVDRTLTDDDTRLVSAYVREHIPALSSGATASSTCMYTSTPDEHFVVGAHPKDPRIILGSACSGHGYKMTIALAEAIAQLVVDGRTEHDLSLFRPDRFDSVDAG